MAKDKNYVSVGYWIFAKILMMIPCLNIVFMIILAFTGENETRKNYFKAELLCYALVLVIMGICFLTGLSPLIYNLIQDQISHLKLH